MGKTNFRLVCSKRFEPASSVEWSRDIEDITYPISIFSIDGTILFEGDSNFAKLRDEHEDDLISEIGSYIDALSGEEYWDLAINV